MLDFTQTSSVTSHKINTFSFKEQMIEMIMHEHLHDKKKKKKKTLKIWLMDNILIIFTHGNLTLQLPDEVR